MWQLLLQGADIEGEEGEIKASQKASGCGKLGADYSEPRIRQCKVFLCHYSCFYKKMKPLASVPIHRQQPVSLDFVRKRHSLR